MNRRILITLIVVLLLCIGLVVGGTVSLIAQSRGGPRPIGLDASPVPTVALAAPLPETTPLPSVSSATADALLRVEIPQRDLYQIVPRLRKNLALLTPVPTPAPRPRRVGEHDKFYVIENASTGQYRTVTATLQVLTPGAYFWVEDGLKFEPSALQKAANFFDQSILPTNQKYFGNVRPGLDGDTRIHVLNTHFQDAAGYFSSVDTFPIRLVPFSNQRNIIYMNIQAVKPGTDEYTGDLAHEFQHLIHNYEAQHKTGWIDEGLGDVAIKVNGFPVVGVVDVFARNPNTQLNTWANEPQASAAHYAASYLFFDFAMGRFGPDWIRDVIHAPREGVNGVQAVLDRRAGGLRFEELFADWAITNYLNDPTVENGRYVYTNESAFHIIREPVLSQYPITRSLRMHQYAANYFTLQPADRDITVYFTGTTTAKLLAVNAHAGNWMWYSNRADLSNMTLTRQFDLTRASQATLQFWTWYDIETDYDYAYVQVSTDGGKTWDILPGRHTTTSNPNGASYGSAYTGRSGVGAEKSGPPAQWIQEQIDLSSYAGKTVLLRLEYITDDAYNAPSLALDDIAIPEIGFSDDVERGDNGWQAAGFLRTDNVLPQRYIVQVVQVGAPTRVVRIPLNDLNRGKLTIAGFGKSVSRAELVVTAFAPTTTELTEYQLGIALQ